MGTCTSSQCRSKDGNFSWKSTVNTVHFDGKLQQWKQPLKAELVLSQKPNCFICSSDSMHIGSLLPHVTPSEELQLDQIYFPMPLSRSHIPLSLQELCALAIKADSALTHSILNSSSVSLRSCLTHPKLLVKCFSEYSCLRF